jgi:hypothetical protein
MEKLPRHTCASIGLAVAAALAGSAFGKDATDVKVPTLSFGALSELHTLKFVLPNTGHGLTSLPLNAPPINGFVPQVVFGLTDEQAPNDFNFASHKSSSPGGNTLPFGGPQYFTTAVFDTGSQSHLISYADTQLFNFDSADRTGDATQDVAGASGTETTDVTDAVGVYATGFANASVNGSGSLTVTPGSLIGQYNTSVLTAEEGSSLPNLIGAPMAAQYQTVIKNTTTQHLMIGGQTLRTPAVSFQTLSTALPTGYSKLTLSVQSVNGVTHDPVFFPSLENFDNLSDNPSTPSFWASLFAKATVTHTGGSVNNQDFLFDTGAQVSVISEDTAAQVGIYTGGENPTPPDFFVEVAGVGGTTTEVPGFYINSLNVVTNGGPITWSHVPVLLLNIIDPRTGSGFVPGILGTNLFGDRDLIVNADTNNPFVGISPAWAWAATGGGSWSNSANWKMVLPNGVDAQANFLALTGQTAPQTITVDSPGFTVGSIAFDNANHYTINGPGRITLDVSTDHAQINVSTGSHTIAAPMTFADDTDITVAFASSVLTVTTDVTATGVAINKEGPGTLEMKNVRASALNVDQGTVRILPADGFYTPASLVTSLSFGGMNPPAGQLDLGGAPLAIDYAGTSPASDVQSFLRAGYANGAWTGNGITSSTAAAMASSANSHKTAIGFAEASAIGSPSSWFGQSITGDAILMRYTYVGDANLDGTVNTADFTALAANFSKSGEFWWQGDFNFDGVVNALDFNAIAINFGQVLPADVLGTLVPEPSMLVLLAIGGLLVHRRRRCC